METLEIAVQTDRGPKQIQAECDSGLAIHPSVGFGDQWRVTHIATGLTIPVYALRTRADALYAMGVMLSWGIDWSADDVAKRKGLVGRVKKLKQEMEARR